MRRIIALMAALSLGGAANLPRPPFIDSTHMSKVFGEERHCRIFLPSNYNTSM